MKNFIVIFFLLIAAQGGAQNQFFQSFSGNDYDEAYGVTQLADSSYLICGSSSSFNSGSTQAFLLKMTKEGIFEWSKEYGGSESDVANRVLNCGDSALYLVGSSNSNATGNYDFFMIKTSLDGTQLFEKKYVKSGWDKVNDALIGTDSMLYIVGESSSIGKGTECYLLKLNLAGDTVWSKSYGSIGDDGLKAIRQVNDTTMIAVGYYYNADSTFTKGYVLKFLTNGQIIWQKEIGANGNYALNDFYLDADKLKGVGTHTHPLGDLDSWLIRIDLQGVLEASIETHDQGDYIHENVAPIGISGKMYISSSYKNQYSASYSWDNGYERFSSDFTWDDVSINVTMMFTEKGNHLIKTKDNGLISVGTITSNEFGGSLAFALKIGPNSEFPTISLLNTQSILALDQVEDATWSIYPNPSQGEVRITSNKSGIIEVYSNIGELLDVQPTSGKLQLNCSNYPKGFYLVRLTDGENQAVRKFVIE
jgi:hypothetical protein